MHRAATTFGVDIDIGSRTGRRGPAHLRLIADIPPGWFAQQDLGFNPHETVMDLKKHRTGIGDTNHTTSVSGAVMLSPVKKMVAILLVFHKLL